MNCTSVMLFSCTFGRKDVWTLDRHWRLNGNRKCRNEDSEIDDKCPKRMKIKGPDFFVGYSNVLNSVFVWELWQCILGVNHLMIEDIVYVE